MAEKGAPRIKREENEFPQKIFWSSLKQEVHKPKGIQKIFLPKLFCESRKTQTGECRCEITHYICTHISSTLAGNCFLMLTNWEGLQQIEGGLFSQGSQWTKRVLFKMIVSDCLPKLHVVLCSPIESLQPGYWDTQELPCDETDWSQFLFNKKGVFMNRHKMIMMPKLYTVHLCIGKNSRIKKASCFISM